jgi:hypothetical protein
VSASGQAQARDTIPPVTDRQKVGFFPDPGIHSTDPVGKRQQKYNGEVSDLITAVTKARIIMKTKVSAFLRYRMPLTLRWKH